MAGHKPSEKKKMMYGGMAREKMYGGSMGRKKQCMVDHTIIWTELAWLWAVQWKFKNLTKHESKSSKGYHWMKQKMVVIN